MTDISFSEFMAARWTPLYRTAYLLTGRREEAEDLLQSALARTCVRWDKIRDKRAADAYVRKAMLNQMSRQWRTRRREEPTEELPDAGHDGRLGVRAEHLDLWTEIRRLPPRMRGHHCPPVRRGPLRGRHRRRARLLGRLREEPDPPRAEAAAQRAARAPPDHQGDS